MQADIQRRDEDPQAPDAETDFGFSTVRLDKKQGLVDDVFHKVAARYDLMNDMMSGGLHRVWKNILISKLGLGRRRSFRHLDVAGGTGDVAFRIARAGGPGAHVTVADINTGMLDVGRARAQKMSRRDDGGRIDFVEANAEALPFEDGTFDGYTIAFGIRNVPRRDKALAEAYRVLRRGGRFLCLEFSEVDVPVIDEIYKAYAFTAIPALGKAIAGDGQPYRYLVESIAQFPGPDEFRGMIQAAGFQRASYQRLTGGVVCIHSGWKL